MSNVVIGCSVRFFSINLSIADHAYFAQPAFQEQHRVTHMTAVPLRERQRAQTKIEIRRAAIELFELQGFAATTVDEIAQAAGVSARTVYNHFRDKDEVLTFPLDSVLPVILIEAKRFGPGDTGAEVAVVRAVLRAIETDPERSELLRRANRIIGSNPALDAIIGRQQLEWERALSAALLRNSPTVSERARVTAAVSLGRISMTAWVDAENQALASIFDQCVEALSTFDTEN
jgi:AcrR family transcriptional regulator